MNDVFIEYMVRRRNTAKIALLKVGIIVGALVLSLLLFTLSGFLGAFSFVGTLAAFAAIYGAYILLTSQNVEFEYAVTNGEMDVDRILAQRKRQRLITVKCREAEAFGRYKAGEHANKTYAKKIFACDAPDSEELWYFVTRSAGDGGTVLLVFNASEKMLNGIKPFLPRPIMHEAFKMGN